MKPAQEELLLGRFVRAGLVFAPRLCAADGRHQFLPRPELDSLARGHVDLLTCLRIDANARRGVLDREYAEADQPDGVACLQGIADGIERGVDEGRALLDALVGRGGHALDELLSPYWHSS